MNRAERRQQGISMRVYSQIELDKALTEARRASLQLAIKGMTAAFTIALHDIAGFGPTRTKRIIDHVNNTFKCIGAGTVSLEDLVELSKELGVDIK